MVVGSAERLVARWSSLPLGYLKLSIPFELWSVSPLVKELLVHQCVRLALHLLPTMCPECLS
jgi:hypothetical protein